MKRRELLKLGLYGVLVSCSDQRERSVTGPGETAAASQSPQPAAPTPSSGSSSDQINLSTVVWLHTDVSGWRQTSTVTGTSISDSSICIEHTKSGQWPRIQHNGEGNPWIFVNLNGVWHAATYEWIRSGQTCKGVTRSGSTSVGRHTKTALLGSWVPARGEEVGLMVSTPARSNQRTSNERSNVVRARWP